jgi:hypothetical protein
MLHGAAHWKGTIYIDPQKVSKNPKLYCTHSNLPKNGKSRFGCLGPLGVNKGLFS